VLDKVINWTEMGLLAPRGKKRPGTGRYRLYPETAVIDALILSALAAVGIPAVRSREFRQDGMTALQLAKMAWEYEQSNDGSVVWYLVIAVRNYWPSNLGAHVYLQKGKTELPDADHLKFYADTARPVPFPVKTQDDVRVPGHADVITVINLTNLFKPLKEKGFGNG
jgi:hypothetical protein